MVSKMVRIVAVCLCAVFIYAAYGADRNPGIYYALGLACLVGAIFYPRLTRMFRVPNWYKRTRDDVQVVAPYHQSFYNLFNQANQLDNYIGLDICVEVVNTFRDRGDYEGAERFTLSVRGYAYTLGKTIKQSSSDLKRQVTDHLRSGEVEAAFVLVQQHEKHKNLLGRTKKVDDDAHAIAKIEERFAKIKKIEERFDEVDKQFLDELKNCHAAASQAANGTGREFKKAIYDLETIFEDFRNRTTAMRRRSA